jgi:hypothetical protein
MNMCRLCVCVYFDYLSFSPRAVVFLFVTIRALPAIQYIKLLHTFGGDFGGGAYQPLPTAIAAATGMDITRVLTDGMFISILSSDFILAKMASRNVGVSLRFIHVFMCTIHRN